MATTEQFHLDELLRSAEMRAPKSALASVSLLSRAITVLAAQIEALAPEAAPPVPVTVPDSPPAVAGMTAEAFYAELAALDRRMFDGVPSGSVQEQRLRMCSSLLVDLGARWRAATGLPLPTRPKGPTR